MSAVHIAAIVCWATAMITITHAGIVLHDLADILCSRKLPKDNY